jgi:NDP-sugar pyrophosphorylase family protein
MMPIAILAGGLATRLRPLTETIPKSLIEVAGEPFISHQLRLLRKKGAERVVLCLGHLGAMVEHVVGNGQAWGLEVAYSFDGEKLLGTGGALKRALPFLGEKFFVVYGDSYLDDDFAAIEQAYLASGKAALMTVLYNLDKWDRSNVRFRDGKIEVYDKTHRTADMQHVDWGLGALTAHAFDAYPDTEPFDLARVYRDLLYVDQLAGYEVHRRFYEIGSTEGIRDTEEYLSSSRRGGVNP